jgi:hypothetical protein
MSLYWNNKKPDIKDVELSLREGAGVSAGIHRIR